MPNYDTHFPSVRDQVSPEEWATRVELAACYRLVDKFGMTDLIYNHITACIPGTDHMLINLYGLLYKEITASSLVKIDLAGNILAKPDTDYGINKSGYVIHGAIHEARQDVRCVIHTHSRAGMAVASMACGLLPMTQTAIRFHGHIGYHDFEGPAVDVAGAAFAQLGEFGRGLRLGIGPLVRGEAGRAADVATLCHAAGDFQPCPALLGGVPE